MGFKSRQHCKDQLATFLAFTGGERAQVKLRALFLAQEGYLGRTSDIPLR